MDDEEYEATVSPKSDLFTVPLSNLWPLDTNHNHSVKVHVLKFLFIYSQNFGQPLMRVLNGNYVYRVFLRCRHAAKLRFIKLRSDVLVKLQLLDNKRGGQG